MYKILGRLILKLNITSIPTGPYVAQKIPSGLVWAACPPKKETGTAHDAMGTLDQQNDGMKELPLAFCWLEFQTVYEFSELRLSFFLFGYDRFGALNAYI